MNDCIFCKIAKQEILSDVIFEDNDFFVFLDVKPIQKGHILVIPKKHFRNLLDLDDNLASKYLILIKKISNAIIKAVNADGVNVSINNEKVAGQEVFHTHFHIIPRFKCDGLKVWPRLEETFDSELIKQEIAKYL